MEPISDSLRGKFEIRDTPRSEKQSENDDRVELIKEIVFWQEKGKWFKRLKHLPTSEIRHFYQFSLKEGKNPPAFFNHLISKGFDTLK